MATPDSTKAEKRATKGAVILEGRNEIPGTGGLEPATTAWTADHLQKRRDHKLVAADQSNKQVFHSRGGKIERRRARSNHSAFNCSKGASAAADFATITTRDPAGIWAMHDLRISRRRRRTLLRITAPPTRREVMMPTLAESTLPVRRRPMRMRRAWDDFPCSRTRVKSLV